MTTVNLTESQYQTYDFIKHFIKDEGYAPTTAEITKGLGLKSRSAVHRNLQAISTEGLISLLPNRRRNIRLNETFEDELLPLVGRIAAGQPIETIAQREQEHVNVNDILSGQDRYMLEVKGDSMLGDNICDGDLVVCQRTHDAKRGQIAVVIVNRDEATLKRVMRDTENGKVILIPSNPSHAPQEYDAANVEIQGVYLGLLRLGNLRQAAQAA
tara:strand:+ start:67866 stop:68504 length:639 start_codon:yes stop_codon:yes gene_type:complete